MLKTHSAKVFDVNQFNKTPGLDCVYDKIDWLDENGENQSVSCLDKKKKYKGISQILVDLNLIESTALPKDYLLPRLREILATHPAFNDTRLQQAATKHGVTIIWNPKYHCELNPIEGIYLFKYFLIA